MLHVNKPPSPPRPVRAGKFGGLFASLPQAMVSGLFCIMFGLIAAVGLSQMQHADQNSPRNIFILGFSLYMGLSVPYYFVRLRALPLEIMIPACCAEHPSP